MKREEQIERLQERGVVWDLLVIGGGATGVGIAVDAASRGYHVALIERADFGQGTSSLSTKLVHGGVRYLEQGNVGLVMEALREGIRKRRDEALITQINTDPHSPEEFRINGVVRNMDAWYEAFGVEPGDELYLAPEDRVSIW